MSYSQQTNSTQNVHNTQVSPVNTIFVGNVPFTCTQDQFKSGYSHLPGYVSSSLIMRNNSTMSRGFGHVQFSTQEDVNNALKQSIAFENREVRMSPFMASMTGLSRNLNTTTRYTQPRSILSRSTQPRSSQPRSSQPRSTSYSNFRNLNTQDTHATTFHVFVDSLPEKCTEDQLANLFKHYTGYVSCTTRFTGKKTIGTLVFSSDVSYNQALSTPVMLDNNLLYLRPFRMHAASTSRNNMQAPFSMRTPKPIQPSRFFKPDFNASSSSTSSTTSTSGSSSNKEVGTEYLDGYRAGHVIGFQEGLQKGLKYVEQVDAK